MSLFGRSTISQDHQSRAVRGGDVAGRLARGLGRVLLWGCVLLLLVRGIVSVLDPSPTVRVPTQTVTVTQPARTAPSMAQER